MEYDASVFDEMDVDFKWGCGLGYESVLDTFGYEVVLYETLGSWQGDIVTILKDGTRFGFLMFGYGSCSGCDALEGTSTLDDLKALAIGLHSDIRWFESMSDLARWLVKAIVNYDEDSVPGSWYYYDNDVKDWAKGFTDNIGKAT